MTTKHLETSNHEEVSLPEEKELRDNIQGEAGALAEDIHNTLEQKTTNNLESNQKSDAEGINDSKENNEVLEHWIDITDKKETYAKRLKLDAGKIQELLFDQDAKVYKVVINDEVTGPNDTKYNFSSTLYIQQEKVGTSTVYKPYNNSNYKNVYIIQNGDEKFPCFENVKGGFIKYHNLCFKVWNTKATAENNPSFNYEIAFDEKKSEELMRKEIQGASLNFSEIAFGSDSELDNKTGQIYRAELLKNLDFTNYMDAEETQKFAKGENCKWTKEENPLQAIYDASTMNKTDIIKEFTQSIKLDKNIEKETGKWEFTRDIVLSDTNGTFYPIGLKVKYVLDEKGNLTIDEDSLKGQKISLYGATIDGISFTANGLEVKMDIDKNALEKYRLDRTKLHNGINTMITNTNGTEIIGVTNTTELFNYFDDEKSTGSPMQDPLKIKGNYFENENFRIPFVLDEEGGIKFQDEYGNNVETITIKSKDGTKEINLSIENGIVKTPRTGASAERYQYLSIFKEGHQEAENLQGHFIPGVTNDKGEIQFYDRTTNQAVATCKVTHDAKKGYQFDLAEQSKVDLKPEYFHEDLKARLRNLNLPTNIKGISESTLIDIFDAEFEKVKKENTEWKSLDGLVYANKFFLIQGEGTNIQLTPNIPEPVRKLFDNVSNFATQITEISNLQVNFDGRPLSEVQSGSSGISLQFNVNDLVKLYQGQDKEYLTVQLGKDIISQNNLNNELKFRFDGQKFRMDTQEVYFCDTNCSVGFNGNETEGESEDKKRRRQNNQTSTQKIVTITSH